MPRRAEVGAVPTTRPDVPKLPHRSLKPYEARHLLAVDQPILWPLLEKLVLARFSAPRWIVPPVGFTGPDGTAARTAPSGTPATLALTLHTTLSGPYRDSDGWSQRVVYDVVGPRERWDDPPFTGGGDRDGLARAFPGGLPNREEGRVVDWLIAVARRLGGSVKVDVGNAGLPVNFVEVVLSPFPERNVDRTVLSPKLLDAERALALAQGVLPQAQLATSGFEYQGPDAALRRGVLPAGLQLEGLDDFDLADLHEAADEFDMAVLREAREPEGYGILADLGLDGQLVIEVDREAADAWRGGSGRAAADQVAYRVYWVPADLVEAGWEFPNAMFIATADRVQTTAHNVAAAIAAAVDGALVDQGGLPLEREGTTADGGPVRRRGHLTGRGETPVARSRGTMCEIPFDV